MCAYFFVVENVVDTYTSFDYSTLQKPLLHLQTLSSTYVFKRNVVKADIKCFVDGPESIQLQD